MRKIVCQCGRTLGDGFIKPKCPFCDTTPTLREAKDISWENDEVAVVSAARLDLYVMAIGVNINVPEDWYFPMMEKYCREIHMIRIKYDECQSVINKMADEYRIKYNAYMNNLDSINKSLTSELAAAKREYEELCKTAAKFPAYLVKCQEKADQIEDLNKKITNLISDSKIATKKFIEENKYDPESLPEYKLMQQLHDMAFNYAKQIRDDYKKYYNYLKCIHGLMSGRIDAESVDYAIEFMEYNISDEDEKYLSLVNSCYTSHEQYAALAGSILRRKATEDEMIRRSKAREVKIADPGIMDYAIETDPYTRLANISVIEHQMINDILNFGSINCTLI